MKKHMSEDRLFSINAGLASLNEKENTHLSECVECKDRYDLYKIFFTPGNNSFLRPSQSVLNRIHSSIEKIEKPDKKRALVWKITAGAAIAAAVCIIVFASITLNNRYDDNIYISSLVGDVYVNGETAHKGKRLHIGDKVVSSVTSNCVITAPKKSSLMLMSGTEILIGEKLYHDRKYIDLKMSRGRLEVDDRSREGLLLSSAGLVSVKSPTSRYFISVGNGNASIQVVKGKVEVANSATGKTFQADEGVVVDSNGNTFGQGNSEATRVQPDNATDKIEIEKNPVKGTDVNEDQKKDVPVEDSEEQSEEKKYTDKAVKEKQKENIKEKQKERIKENAKGSGHDSSDNSKKNNPGNSSGKDKNGGKSNSGKTNGNDGKKPPKDKPPKDKPKDKPPKDKPPK